MNQAWLQVAGLVFDILGFGVIAWEWILAQRADAAARAIEEERERQEESADHLARAMKDPNPSFQLHMDMTAQSRRRLAKSRLGAARAEFARRRYGAIYAGMLLVLAGFLLQLLGAWPGCCAMIGIMPAG